MKKTLNSAGYPEVLNNGYETKADKQNLEKVKESDFYKNKTSGSLQYLFDSSLDFVQGSGTASSYSTGANSYQSQHFTVESPKGLFKLNTDNGMYYYDSLLNSAYFQRNKDAKGNLTNTGNFKLFDYTTSLRYAGYKIHKYKTEEPYATTTGHASSNGNFFPFNLASEEGDVFYGAKREESVVNTKDDIGVRPKIEIESNDYVTYDEDAPVNYRLSNSISDESKKIDAWFGMTMECDFQMTSDGTYNGKPMEFKFTGDDDVWVYIDGILVLDIGGTHGAQTGTINFATGDVYYQQNADGEADGTWNKINTNLKSLYTEAIKKEDGTLGSYTYNGTTIDKNYLDTQFKTTATDSTKYTFKSNTKHKLSFYYLERGGYISYCQLQFNLPKGSVGVSKKVEGLDSDLSDPRTYTFQLQDENGNPFTSTKEPNLTQLTYLYEKADGTTEDNKTMYIGGDNDCKFTLKDGESVIFHDIPDGDQYKIVELDSPTGTNVSSTVKQGTEVATDYHNGDVLTADSSKFAQITYSNAVPVNSLNLVTKVLDPDDYEVDEMPNSTYYIGLHIFDKNENGEIVNDYGTKLIPVSGATELNTTKELTGLPSGASYELWEYMPDDTENRYEAPKLSDENGTKNYTARLVETGSTPALNDVISGSVSGQTLTVVNKLIANNSIAVTFKYYDRDTVTTSGDIANINSTETSYSKTVDLTDSAYESYVDKDNEYKIKNNSIFVQMITNVGAAASTNGVIDNVVDSYELFTSQKSAVNAVKGYTYTIGKSDNYATHTITDDEAVYHTDSKRRPTYNTSKQEKWVTYYQSGTVVDPENDESVDLDKITGITVWLYNKPKTYTVTTHVFDENGNKKEIEYSAYYNQQLGAYSGNDLEECYNYCENYSIPLAEYDARGKNRLNSSDTTKYEDSGALASTSDGKFSYWTDKNGNILSVDPSYLYRITGSMDMYANYGKTVGNGVVSTNEGIDVYYDSNGTKKLRLNTIMNPYGFEFGKSRGNPNIKYTAVAYLSLSNPDVLPSADMIDGENGIKDTIKTTAASIVNDIGSNTKGSASFEVKNGDDVIGTVKVIVYATNDGKLLTNKNRLHFTAGYNSPTGDNVKKVLAFTSLYYNEENSNNNGWYVSDNYVTHTMTSQIGVSQGTDN